MRRPGGPKRAPRGRRGGLSGSKSNPKSPLRGLKTQKKAPRVAPMGPKLKRVTALKMCFLNGFCLPRFSAHDVSKRAQEEPLRSPRSLKTAKESPKRPPKWPKRRHRHTKVIAGIS